MHTLRKFRFIFDPIYSTFHNFTIQLKRKTNVRPKLCTFSNFLLLHCVIYIHVTVKT